MVELVVGADVLEVKLTEEMVLGVTVEKPVTEDEKLGTTLKVDMSALIETVELVELLRLRDCEGAAVLKLLLAVKSIVAEGDHVYTPLGDVEHDSVGAALDVRLGGSLAVTDTLLVAPAVGVVGARGDAVPEAPAVGPVTVALSERVALAVGDALPVAAAVVLAVSDARPLADAAVAEPDAVPVADCDSVAVADGVVEAVREADAEKE